MNIRGRQKETMMTNAFREDIAEAHEVGLDSHIAKPIEFVMFYCTLYVIFINHC